MTEPVPVNLKPVKSVPKIVPVAREDPDGMFADTFSSPTSSKINELKIYLPSLQDLYREMYQQIQTNTVNILEEILQNIAKDKGLNFIELREDYLIPLQNLMEVNQNQLNTGTTDIQNKKQRKIDPTEQCMARTQGGCQCSRKKQTNYDFCGSHLTSQPNGRIDHPPLHSTKPHKRRGRPPKKISTIQDYPTILPKDLISENTYAEMTAAINGSNQISSTKPTSQIKPKASQIKKKQLKKIEPTELQSIVQETDKPKQNSSIQVEEEITQVNFRMLEVSGKPIIIDDDTNKIYEMPDLESNGGTIDIADLKHIGNLEPNGNLLFL